MNKRLTKPHERNVRIEAPLGLLGVPPDFMPCCRCCCVGCMIMHCRGRKKSKSWKQ